MNWPASHCSWEILNELAPRAKTYLGIGVNEGGCVRTVVAANPEIDLTLCDTWGTIHGGLGRGSHRHIVELLEKAGHRGKVRFLDGPSQSLIPAETAPVDLSYVDGHHGYDEALVDLRNAWRLTKYALVCHDMMTSFDKVTLAMLTFLSEQPEPIPVMFRQDTMVLWRPR